MNKDLKFPLNIQLFGGGEADPVDPPTDPTPPKTFTQEEVDKIVAERVAREKKQGTPATVTNPPASVNPEVTTPELPVVDDVLVKKYVHAELKSAMMLEGIDPTKVARAVRLLDADSVLNEAGDVDSEKVATQIADLLKEWPELKAQGAQEKLGFKIGSDGSNTNTDADAIAKAFGNI